MKSEGLCGSNLFIL